MPARRSEKYLIALLLGAALVRIVYLAALARTPFFRYGLLDAEYYLQWALKLTAGGGQSFQGNLLYPHFLAFFLRSQSLFDPAWSIRVAQALLGMATTAAVFFLGRRLLGVRTGAAAAALFALQPAARFYEGWILSVSLETFLAAAGAAVLVTRKPEEPGTGAAGAGGLLFGLGFLARPTLLPLGALLWLAIEPGKGRIRHIAAAGAGFALVLGAAGAAGWGILPRHGGENFFIGNNPAANGTGRVPDFARPHPMFQHGDFLREASRRADGDLTPGEANAFWRNEGLAWLSRHPLAALRLAAIKAALLFSGAEFPDNYHLGFFAGRLPLWGSGLFWRFLAAAGLTGMILARNKRRLSLIYLLVIASSAGTCLFFVTSRARFPLTPFLCLFAAEAGAGAIASPRKLRGKIGGRAALAVGIFLLLGFPFSGTSPESYGLTAAEALFRDGNYEETLVLLKQAETSPEAREGENLPRFRRRLNLARGKTLLALGRDREARQALEAFAEEGAGEKEAAERAFEIGNACAALERFEQSGAWYRRALREDPLYAPAHNNLGLVLKRQGQGAAAEKEFRTAAALDPGYAAALVNLGNILRERGEAGEAEDCYRAALNLDRSLVRARYALAVLLAEAGRREEARDEIRQLPPTLRSRIEAAGR